MENKKLCLITVTIDGKSDLEKKNEIIENLFPPKITLEEEDRFNIEFKSELTHYGMDEIEKLFAFLTLAEKNNIHYELTANSKEWELYKKTIRKINYRINKIEKMFETACVEKL